MSKEQIEEMARVLDEAKIDARATIGSMNYGFGMWYAKAVYNAGYRKQSEWISVDERPPEENGIYCVIVKNHKSRKYTQRTHARYKNGRWLDLYDNWENRCWDVTHWMPLPEPPKGE